VYAVEERVRSVTSLRRGERENTKIAEQIL
jgi:hypothetical protein